MKWIFLFTSFLLRSILGFAYKLEIENFFYNRCKNNTDDETSNELRKRLNDTYNEFHTELKDDKPNFCPDNHITMVEKMKQLAIDLKPCFSNEEEQYLSDFVSEGFARFMEFVCADRTIEIFFSPQGEDCREALIKYRRGQEIKNCSKELYKTFHKNVLRHEELCQDLKSAEACFAKAINNGCPHFKAFEVLSNQLFNAVGTKCSTASIFHYSGTTLLVAFILNYVYNF